MTLSEQLHAGVKDLGLKLDEDQRQRLLKYLALMSKWNQVHNLTAIRNPADMVSHHLLDSLAVVPYVEDGPLLDVGSGAGLPGIPLAIAKPTQAITTLDSNDKKCAFMRQAVAELNIMNVSVCFHRVEDWKPSNTFAQVVSRAFSELSNFVKSCAHLLSPGGHLLAMKGQLPRDEIARLPTNFEVKRIEPLEVPGLDAERHLLWIAAK
ncbi:MAG TPA: 16S rRNA (guanine(527)-N(7))-methyltransferase RsmG [Burkholderiales bacterium]|nr:16S rRNA (guanine(527)-N(7))-methyltransferase RsmG [Burkholderiales bacterium]